ncbi:MAG: hemolysin III family protein [Eubacterium sp.]|nr:hemolysin III family protein [Eubacterium sp.]
MKRTKLADRTLPDYTRGEEIFNMVSHIVGGAFGVISLGLCTGFSIYHKNWWGLAGGIIYSLMMIYLYTISSVYHGIKPEGAKKVMQVLDHCTIFALIFGSYMPLLLTGIREYYPVIFWITLSILIVATAVCVTFTAIDFKRYAVIANIGYFGIGWTALILIYPMFKIYGLEIVIWTFCGGLAYTLGIIFFALQKKKRYMHSIFHLFILLGTALQFVAIFKFCI